MKKIKLIADTINGVYKVDSFYDYDSNDLTTMGQSDFYDTLKTDFTGAIGAEVTESMAELIDAEYGIH